MYFNNNMQAPINNLISIAYLKNTFDSKYKLIGVSGQTISISSFQEILEFNLNDFTTLLVNFDGNMIISPYFNEKIFDNSLKISFFD